MFVRDILKLRKQGVSLEELGNMLGVTRNTVRDRMKKLGYRHSATEFVYEGKGAQPLDYNLALNKVFNTPSKDVKGYSELEMKVQALEIRLKAIETFLDSEDIGVRVSRLEMGVDTLGEKYNTIKMTEEQPTSLRHMILSYGNKNLGENYKQASYKMYSENVIGLETLANKYNVTIKELVNYAVDSLIKIEKKRTSKKNPEFLFNYSWKGKSREQIISEMELSEYEQAYLDKAMNQLNLEGKFDGYSLDSQILLFLDMEENDVY